MSAPDPDTVQLPHSFSEVLKVHFDDGQFSDVVVKCGSSTWKLHQVILCSYSPWFKAACTGAFLESHTKEIVIHDENPIALEAVLKSLYGLEIHAKLPGSDNDFLNLIEQYRIANFLQLNKLEKGLLDLFMTVFTRSVRAAAEHSIRHCNQVEFSIYPEVEDDSQLDSHLILAFCEALSCACLNFGADQDNKLFDILISASVFCARVMAVGYQDLASDCALDTTYRTACWGCETLFFPQGEDRLVFQGLNMIMFCSSCYEVVAKGSLSLLWKRSGTKWSADDEEEPTPK
ncbi:hypothetical protein BT63DRAFT_473593 [Microthyrium microscopicum]|uniref:BTB domain-containing protein n=1 Tax=Microthyrium microscopicum TaxID=703497 RepID=A0A6A6U6G1_9PEZI|nr:hypothetical protein BT63DRAFT_473593 [Microthyrium microscopicum]